MPIRNLERQWPSVEEDALAMRRFLEQFKNIPVLFGTPVSVSMRAGETLAVVFHSLNRPYIGGVAINQTGGGLSEGVMVHEAASAVELGYIKDASKQMSLATRRPLLTDKTFLIWLW